MNAIEEPPSHVAPTSHRGSENDTSDRSDVFASLNFAVIYCFVDTIIIHEALDTEIEV